MDNKKQKLLLSFAKAALQGELACQKPDWEWSKNNIDGLAARCFDIASVMVAEAMNRGIVASNEEE